MFGSFYSFISAGAICNIYSCPFECENSKGKVVQTVRVIAEKGKVINILQTDSILRYIEIQHRSSNQIVFRDTQKLLFKQEHPSTSWSI